VNGNPVKVIKECFTQESILALEEITKHQNIIVSADIEALKACADVWVN